MKRFFSLLLMAILAMSFMAMAGYAEETITVKMVDWEVEDAVLSAMGTGETTTDNRYIDALREEAGIEVEYLWTCASGEYSEKLGMALASGDLPDIIPFTDLNQLHQAYEAGYVQDLSGVFEEYASDLLKEIYAYDNNVGFSTVTFDGFVSAFPGITPAYDSNAILFIRKDWLDNLGMKEPTNLEELTEVIRAFTEDDPDGNGENDTYGISMGSKVTLSYGRMHGLAAAFGVHPGYWYADEEGTVHFGSIEPEMKEFLSYLNDLYTKGYINPEFYTKSNAVLLEDITAGKVGVVYSPCWFPFSGQSSHNLNGAMWRAYPLISKESGEIAPTLVSTGFHAYFAVREGFEHPEVVIEMANLFAEKIWGSSEEGASYWFGVGDSEGIWRLSPIAFLHPMNNFLIYEGFQQIAETGSTEGVFPLTLGFYESCLKYRNEGDGNNWGCEYGMSDNPYSSSASNYRTFEAGVEVSRLNTWTQSSSDYGDVLDQIITPAITKMITGEYTEADFDKAVEQWLASGGQAWIDEYQAWYDAL